MFFLMGLFDFDETLCEFMDFIQFQWILQWDNGVRSSSMGLTQPNYAFFCVIYAVGWVETT